MGTEPMIVKAGKALYGPHWQKPLARALKVSPRTIRHWISGNPVPEGAWRDIEALLREREKKLPVTIQKIEKLR